MELTVLEEGRAIAPRTGPFPFAPFLDVMWRHTAGATDRIEVLADERGGMALWHHGDGVGFVGPENLVDYRSPIGESAELLSEALAELPPGTPYRFDSLPDEAANAVADALARRGLPNERRQHEAAAVLSLPLTMDDYMIALGKKERHETRRKIRRFEASLGEAGLQTHREPGPVLEWFFDTHRRADGDKASFMTPAMEKLFIDLIALEGWRLDVLHGEAREPIAATFGYAGDGGYYLYNSAYDPSYRDTSPGVVLLTSLIERAIDEQLEVFDFLKGDEGYKFRMGAVARPLYVFEGTT